MKLTNRFKFRSPWLALSILALGAGWVTTHQSDAGAALACLPLLGVPMRKQDMDGGNGNQNGGGMSQAEFQSKTLEAVGAVKRQFETIETKFASLDADAKKTAEDFANHCKTFDGLPGQVIEINRSLQAITLKVNNERRANFGSAFEVITGDEQLRTAFNGIIRQSLIKKGVECAINDAQKKGAEDFARAIDPTRAVATTGSPGSTYVNAQLLPAIYSLIAEYGIWRMLDVIPVSTTSVKMIVDSTDMTMDWTAENTQSTEASYTGAQVTATIGKMLGWLAVSNEALADSEIDLAAHLLRKFARATAYRLDWSSTSADGTADITDGGYNGMFFGGTASVAVSGNVSVATLDFEDFLNCMLAVDASVLSMPTARWFMHPTQVVRILSIKDLNGRPIFLPSTDAPALGAIGSILGFPVVLSHTAPSLDGVSKKIAAFGDSLNQAVCLRQDFSFASSDQVLFRQDSTVFRAVARGASKTKVATGFGVLTTAAS